MPVVIILVLVVSVLGYVTYSMIGSEQVAHDKHAGRITDAVPSAPRHAVNLPNRILLKRCGDGWAYLTREDPSKVFQHRAHSEQHLMQYRDKSGTWRNYTEAGYFATDFRFCAKQPFSGSGKEDLAGQWLALYWSPMPKQRAHRLKKKLSLLATVPQSLTLPRCDAGWAHLPLPRHARFMGYQARGPILAEYKDEFGVWLDYKKARGQITTSQLRFCALYPQNTGIIKFSDQYGHPLPLRWQAR